MKKETQGYICPQTKLHCDDECCVSAEDCHIEAGFGIVSDCEPPKQETLEEVALKYFPKTNSHFDRLDEVDGNAYYRSIFKQGAKWQKEQCEKDLEAHLDVAETLWLQAVKENKKMYSEEDLKQAFNVGFNVGYNDETSPSYLTFEKWFEQLKKE